MSNKLPHSSEIKRIDTITIVALVLLGLLLVFELGAVSLLRLSLGDLFEEESEKQKIAQRFDDLRKKMNSISAVKNINKEEVAWANREINNLAGYYRTYQYQLTPESIRSLDHYLGAFEQLYQTYWSNQKFLIQEEQLEKSLIQKNLLHLIPEK